MLNSVQKDQNELSSLIAEARALRAGDLAANAARLSILRWSFHRMLSRHVAFMQNVVFPTAKRLAPPAQLPRIEEMLRDTIHLSEAYQRHVAKFMVNSATLGSGDYQSSADLLTRQVLRLIEREQVHLYPLLQGIANPIER